MTADVKAALQNIEHAANQLSRAAESGPHTEEAREVYRYAALLLLTLDNALQSGAAFKVSGRAEEFDHANQAREDQLHVNPEPNRY